MPKRRGTTRRGARVGASPLTQLCMRWATWARTRKLAALVCGDKKLDLVKIARQALAIKRQ